MIFQACQQEGEITIKTSKGKNLQSTNIVIEDNGEGLTKAQGEKIFEKFYRVPKNNTHDVKGFGIGLYYSKQIIEKHGGSIKLNLRRNLTQFKISLKDE